MRFTEDDYYCYYYYANDAVDVDDDDANSLSQEGRVMNGTGTQTTTVRSCVLLEKMTLNELVSQTVCFFGNDNIN